MSMSHVTCGPV